MSAEQHHEDPSPRAAQRVQVAATTSIALFLVVFILYLVTFIPFNVTELYGALPVLVAGLFLLWFPMIAIAIARRASLGDLGLPDWLGGFIAVFVVSVIVTWFGVALWAHGQAAEIHGHYYLMDKRVIVARLTREQYLLHRRWELHAALGLLGLLYLAPSCFFSYLSRATVKTSSVAVAEVK